MKYKHIVWDWNGTLLDDRWLCIEAINFVLKSREMKLFSVALTGFSGGRSKEFCNLNIHVPENNYGIVEDAHQSIIHSIAQFLRRNHLNKDEDEDKISF